jgi:cytochrome c-type biogenesis protein CcmF
MIRLLGETSLYLALCMAFTQSILPLFGYWRNNAYALACARPSAYAQAIFIFLAYALLTLAFYNSDFSIAYVAANSHPTLALMYRLTAVWGAHEGSILLWIVILNIWTLAFCFAAKKLNTAHYTLTLALLGLISFCFLCFLLFTSNPFLATLTPQTGRDLNPLLQDPGFVIHPPMLYFGYVGFSVAFAITQAALICGQLNYEWSYLTRKFALAAWCFLTLGITLGSWWAYRVLGWGGFWFWDPVENASLLPWLSGLALIHVLILCEKRDTAKAWAALLAIICFALSLLGTFLVRSGVLISVHSFANDPERGLFLLGLLTVLITAALAIYAARISALPSENTPHFSWLSREMALLVNSALLFVAMATVLLGTLYPLILDALRMGSISVGAPYFNSVMMPLVFIIMAFMSIGVALHWQKQSLENLWQHAWKKIILSLIGACALLWSITDDLNLIAILSLSLSFWIILSVKTYTRFYPGMSLAHIGFAVLVIGIMLSSGLNQEREVRIQPGDETSVGPYQFYFVSVKGVGASNYRGVQAKFSVSRKQRHIVDLYPEKRIYTVREMVTTKAAIHPSLFRDLYIALGQPLNDNDWSVRIYYKPFVRWIWLGGIIMILGGLISILQRKPANINSSGINQHKPA